MLCSNYVNYLFVKFTDKLPVPTFNTLCLNTAEGVNYYQLVINLVGTYMYVFEEIIRYYICGPI